MRKGGVVETSGSRRPGSCHAPRVHANLSDMESTAEHDRPRECLNPETLEALRAYLDAAGARATTAQNVGEPPAGLAGYLAQAELPFSRRLLRHIRESGLGEVEVYKRAHVDRKLFSKIRSDPAYQPRKTTVVAFALALRLSPDEAALLLESAGYALSRSSPFDLIVRFFLERQIYDILQVNNALDEFNQPLLNA